DRAVAADASDGLPFTVDRVGSAPEVGGKHVAEELAADRAAAPRGADHGDRGRREERSQRGGDGQVVALVYSRPEVLGGCDRELHLHLAALQLARDPEARV